MRVLHVTPYFAPAFRYGGPPQSILGLCQALGRAGVDVEVFTTTADGDVPLPARPEGVVFGGVRARYFPLAWPKRYWRADGLHAAVAEAAKRADLVHVHGLWNLTGWAGIRAARAAAVPYVLSPRGMWQPAALRRHQVFKAIAYAIVERANLAGAALLHATSEVEARALAGLGPPVALIANGVAPRSVQAADVARLRHRAGVADDDEAVTFLGRLHPIKRLDLLAAAFVAIRRNRPRARLIIAGPDEGGHRRTIEPLLAEVAGSVRWLGPVNDDDKWALFAASRALVQCSDSESFGMSVAEALAAGGAVVVTDRGPWRELAPAGCGLVVAHDARALADGLERVLADPAAAAEMGSRGRVWAAHRFGWDEIADAMIRAYGDALARGAAVA